MTKLKFIVLIVLSSAIAFIGGFFFHKYNSLEVPKYKLIEPLKLQADANEIGALPKGTVLYEYRRGPDIDTFIIFVNTKELTSLQPVRSEHKFTVAPIYAYKE